ncbi:MAG TPA: HlyD family type I secretion periplasmic adaptor subunit [Pararhodobacter sp.]|uniref:HlyD family type I secretion periplasmic adaptor subunit n=1 Tax=Pararhodobacter sp. TaxID=2127056 RepID=UPI002B5A0C0C|nr:HlyD family type I secretion periplasmic adaptor subunit [Pararhodobacter sp.]HPD92009.1 HlyD family type I secretion periplasmic adaptor subunit [Pararhodobacter sp.]
MTLPLDLRARRPLGLGLAACLVLLLGISGWAARAVISGAVLAAGEIDATPARHSIQHAEGGTVAELAVRDGQTVAPGDLLLRLETDAIDGELALIAAQDDEARARQIRLEAERDGSDFPPPSPGDPAAIAAQRALFQARAETLARQRGQLAERRHQAQAEIDGLVRQRAALSRETALIDAALQAQQSLRNQGLALNSQVEALARDAARLDGQRAAFDAREAQVRGQIAEIAQQIETLDATRREEAERDLAETGVRRVELAARRSALRAQRDRMALRAPVAGVVHGLAVGSGAVLRPAQEAMQILARDSPPGIVLRLRPDDIDHVVPGQAVQLHLPALSARHLGDIDGTVRAVSAAALIDERSGQRFFRVEVTLNADAAARLVGAPLAPGMAVQGYIVTGERTPLDYLLAPVRDHMARAMREP